MRQLTAAVILLCSLTLFCTCGRAPQVPPPIDGTAAERAPLTTLDYEVRPTGIFHERDTTDLFRIDPLAPYKPSPVNYPLIYLKSGEVAIATTDAGNRYRIFRWDGDRLTGGRPEAIFAVKHQQVRGPARMPLKSLLEADQTIVYARTFDQIGIQLGLGVINLAPGNTGIWQSVSRVSGNGGVGTELIVGNWGLGSKLGNPTATTPLRLHNEDVTGDQQPETLLTRYWNGEEYFLAGPAALGRAVPALGELSAEALAATPLSAYLPEPRVPYQTVTSLRHLRLTRLPGDTWRVDTLPPAAQITCVNAALMTSAGTFLAGNKTEVAAYAGPRSAAALQLLRPDDTVGFVDLGGARNAAEVRQLVLLDDHHVLLLVAGGEHLVLRF